MANVPDKVTIADMVILPTRQANSYVNNRKNNSNLCFRDIENDCMENVLHEFYEQFHKLNLVIF